ncbi:hypothetical protein GCM10027258_40710 [Amycolatopsis stemonae]
MNAPGNLGGQHGTNGWPQVRCHCRAARDVIDCSSGGITGLPYPGLKTGYEHGRADLVALGRELRYNPNWPLDAARKLGVPDPYVRVNWIVTDRQGRCKRRRGCWPHDRCRGAAEDRPASEDLDES